MEYTEFLDQAIEDGIAAAKESYTEPRQQPNLKGSITGFEICRGKSPLELLDALKDANTAAQVLHGGDDHDAYWEARCKALEIEWICNTVSAAFMHNGMEPFAMVTARGSINAARIIDNAHPN